MIFIMAAAGMPDRYWRLFVQGANGQVTQRFIRVIKGNRSVNEDHGKLKGVRVIEELELNGRHDTEAFNCMRSFNCINLIYMSIVLGRYFNPCLRNTLQSLFSFTHKFLFW